MPKKYEYKTQKNGDIRVQIYLNPDQYAQLEKHAKYNQMDVSSMLDRWIKRFIADRATP